MLNTIFIFFNFISALCYIILGTFASAMLSIICSLIFCWLYDISIFSKHDSDIPKEDILERTKYYKNITDEEFYNLRAYDRYHNNMLKKRTNPHTATFYDPSGGLILIVLMTVFCTGFSLCYCVMKCM